MRYSLSIWKKKSFIKLVSGLRSLGGRNSSGRISVYHHGGAAPRILRIVDFKRFVWNVPALVLRLEYNPVSRSLLSFIVYSNGFSSYVLAPNGLKVGDVVHAGSFFSKSIGYCSYLSSFPVGTFVHNLELRNCNGGQLLRAMGSYGRIMSRTTGWVSLKLRSGGLITLPSQVTGTLGSLDYFTFSKKVHNKAGFFRLRGVRPSVRGVAMNPIDHPHGGGEGKSAAGRPSVSRWGWLTKNVKSKKN